MTIRNATSSDMQDLRTMLREYAAWTQAQVCFQNFEQELASLPGQYGSPGGRLLIAEGAGCVALRALDGDTCEMKRLYVRPAYQGTGLGRELVLAVIREARAIGYRRMRLDTLPHMTSAQKLYASLGFYEIAAYEENPEAGVKYLELDLG